MNHRDAESTEKDKNSMFLSSLCSLRLCGSSCFLFWFSFVLLVPLCGHSSSSVSLRDVGRPTLSYHGDFDLSWVVELLFDGAGDVAADAHGVGVACAVCVRNHTQLTAGLNRIRVLHLREAARDRFEVRQALHILLQRLAARPRSA